MSRVTRSAATLLRLSTLASRFVLIFFLARLLSVDEVGFYGLFAATISYVLYIVGFDFYTYSTREMVRSERDTWPTKLQSHVSFAGVLYAFVIPASALLFVFGLLPWSALPWFLILVPLEHIGMELDRVLIVTGDNLAAGIGLFVRQATTPLLLVPLMVAVPGLRNLETVLAGWVLFDILGVSFGWIYLRKRLRGLPRGRTDWAWIRVGIRTSALFLVSTLCLRSFFVADRQVIHLFENLEVLGAYTLFMGIAAGLTNVVSAGVHQFIYPKLIAAAHRGDGRAFRAQLTALGVQTVVVLATLSVAAVIALPFLLTLIDRQTYADYAWMLPWALAVISLYNMSLVPHFALYAVQADRWLLWSTVGATAGFAATIAILLQYGAVIAVLGGIGAASAILLVVKCVGAAMRTRELLAAPGDGNENA